jgi:CheY-like chemotaxis protein
MLRELLSPDFTFDLEHSPDGEAALQRLRTADDFQRPNLVIMPWFGLPKMTGEELLGAIKADDQLRPTPVIVLTSTTAPPVVTTIWSAGAAAVIDASADLERFEKTMSMLKLFWTRVARLPFCDSLPARPPS